MAFVPTTWNPLDKSSQITLSNGDLTASSLDTAHWRSVRSVYGAGSDKYYWEVLSGSGYTDLVVGISVSTADLEKSVGLDVNTCGIYNASSTTTRIYHDLTWNNFSVEFTTGDIIGVALDLDNGEIYFAINGAWLNGGNPETRANPAATGLSGVFNAAVSLYPSYTEPVEYATANFGASSFVYSPPTGYVGGFGETDNVILNDVLYANDSVFNGDEYITDNSSVVSDSVIIDRDQYEKAVLDDLTVEDSIDEFNFTRWLETNYSRAVQRFYFTLTGDADGVEDIEIPIASFQIISSTTTRYISVEIPSTAYASDINLRTSGKLVIERAYALDGMVSLSDIIATAELGEIRIYEGGTNQSITLSGYDSVKTSSNIIDLKQIQTRQIANGALDSVRCAGLDFLVRPGDICRDGIYEMTADTVIHTVSASQQGIDAYVDITAA